MVIALILSLIVGVPMATRFFAEGGRARREWGEAGPTVIEMPVGYGQMARPPDPPAWGMTGGGPYQLLPQPDPYASPQMPAQREQP